MSGVVPDISLAYLAQCLETAPRLLPSAHVDSKPCLPLLKPATIRTTHWLAAHLGISHSLDLATFQIYCSVAVTSLFVAVASSNSFERFEHDDRVSSNDL